MKMRKALALFLCVILLVVIVTAAPQIGELGAKSAEGAEKCNNSQRCKEIDEVWHKITQLVATARKEQIWDTIKNDWGSYAEKYLKTVQLEPIKPTPIVTPGAIKQNLKAVAEREWLRWDQGTKKESDPDMEPVVASYNAAGDCAGNNPTVDPWSAAFISYAAKQAGVSDFPVSCLHTAYFRSIKNNPGICQTYPMSERSRIGVGDIVCVCRVSADEAVAGKKECTIDYNNPSGFGHCDIVVNALSDGRVEVIGGNVENTVAKKVLDVTQDASPDRKWFGFISCGEAPSVAVSSTSENLCVATTGTPEQRALLDTLGWAEATGNRYDMVAYGELVRDPNNQFSKDGDKNVFTSYSTHPQILIDTKRVQGGCTGDPLNSPCTTAAGRYQFLFREYEILKERGFFLTGFNPPEQDKGALQLVADTGVTNELLKNALNTNDFIPVWDKLAPVWASIPSSAHGGGGALGQKGKNAPALQEKYKFCLQYHQSKAGVASPVGGIKEKQDLSAECTVPTENQGKIESSGQGGCPKGMVKVADFCIDRFEGTLVNKNTGEPFSPYCSPSADGKAVSGAILNLKAVSLAGAVPQGYISADQAEHACKNAEKHLCTQSEWLAACQGNVENKFPYGNEEVAGRCNYGRTHPDVKTKEAPNAKWEMTDPQVNKNYALAVTGSFGQCSTPQGVFDMTGNLQEWVNDGDAAYPNRFGGGYYGATLQQVIQEPPFSIGCGFQKVIHPTNHADYSTGFRCCANPGS